jgi:hypothetical protein
MTEDEMMSMAPTALAEHVIGGPCLGEHPLARILAGHPDLATPQQKLAMLELLHAPQAPQSTTRWSREHTLSALIVKALDAALPEEAIPVFARIVPLALGDLRTALVRALIAARHTPTLERLAWELEVAIAARPPVWATGHATKWLVPHVSAIFMLEKERATERFAPHFASDVLADDDRAQVAATILMVGTGYVSNHQVVVKTNEPTTLVHDPRFWSLAASLLSHRRLGGVAKRVLAELPKKEREALAAQVELPAAPAKPSRKRNKKETVYAVGDRVRAFWNDDDWIGFPGAVAEVTGSYYRVLTDAHGLGGITHVSQIAPPLA